jgi:phosphatidylinositol glycan class V
MFVDKYHAPNEAFQTLFEHPKSRVDKHVELVLGGFAKWDAEYFVHIALYGYTHESCIAFFPLWPKLIGATGWVLTLFFHERSAILIAGSILNIILSVAAADAMFRLSGLLFQSDKHKEFCYYVAILFCVNPATIYFSALYSEALFAYLTLDGIYRLYSHPIAFAPIASLLFALGSFVRSNGVINAGFILHALLSYGRPKSSSLPTYLLYVAACTSLSILPYFLVQYWHWNNFCLHSTKDFLAAPEFVQKYLTSNQLVVEGVPEWCESWQFVPNAYSSVQTNLWKVGPFAYFQLRKLPELISALPVFVFITVQLLVSFAKENKWKILSLGGILGKKNSTRGMLVAMWFHSVFLVGFGVVFLYFPVS